MRVHIHLEDGDSPICGMLMDHVPSEGQEITVNVASGVPPNVILMPTKYKVEKVGYTVTEILRKDVPEIHNTILYLSEAIVSVSVVP